MILTKREKLMLNDYSERGYMKLEDFQLYYASQKTIKDKINRFLQCGILQQGDFFRLYINKKLLSESL